MPAIASESKKKRGKGGQRGSSSKQSEQGSQSTSTALLAMIGSGAVLGLAAPGLNQWYLAWFGLVPILIGISTSSSFLQAGFRGLCFGAAYNLVYESWWLGLQPLDWLGFNWWQGWLMAAAAWVILCTHQGLITAIFAALCRLIPMTGDILPQKLKGGLTLPAPLVVPLLWVLVHNKVYNADGLGIPWSMLEYTQYQQLQLIQIAGLIGGIGVGFLIVFANTNLAVLWQTLRKKKANGMLTAESREHAFYQALLAILILSACFIFGGQPNRQIKPVGEPVTASVIQANVNIDMQKTERRYTLPDLLQIHTRLISQIPRPGLCILTESAMPAYLSSEPRLQQSLAGLCTAYNTDMVVGSLDKDLASRPYNSAYGIKSDGTILKEVYHKRFLVPFGEYTPWLINYFPSWVRQLTNTPAGGGFASGREPVVLPFKLGLVAPLICFETLSPELAASSVRKGGQLLVNVSDLAWFHRSTCGDQMVAFSVFRAIENNRYFVFAANTGPSAIIDQTGHIHELSKQGVERVLSGTVRMYSELSPFTRWFF